MLRAVWLQGTGAVGVVGFFIGCVHTYRAWATYFMSRLFSTYIPAVDSADVCCCSAFKRQMMYVIRYAILVLRCRRGRLRPSSMRMAPISWYSCPQPASYPGGFYGTAVIRLGIHYFCQSAKTTYASSIVYRKVSGWMSR